MIRVSNTVRPTLMIKLGHKKNLTLTLPVSRCLLITLVCGALHQMSVIFFAALSFSKRGAGEGSSFFKGGSTR